MRYCAVVFILLTILTSSASAQDSVQVKVGWNLVGSVKEGAVPEVLSSIPDSIIVSSFFGYAPGVGYLLTDTLEKGYGYWVKVASNGVIVFSTTVAIDSCRSKAFIYQGKFYNTVKIGDQCWMAENLDVGVMVAGALNQTDNDTTEKYCYNDSPVNCTLYGGLYQWNETMKYVTTEGTQGICPPGWRIPTYADYQTLSSSVSGNGNTLKARGQGSGAGAGTNASGFSALLAGYRSNILLGNFYNLGEFATFWSSTGSSEWDASYLGLDSPSGGIGLEPNVFELIGLSVRCLED